MFLRKNFNKKRRLGRETAWLSVIVSLLLSFPAVKGQTAATLQADKKAVVEVDHARFTVLTPRLIRMEWDSQKSFDDHASFVVINRRLPVPAYSSRKENGWIYIKTQQLELAYKVNSGSFNGDNLKIRLLSSDTVSWYPGKKQRFNLKGTCRTLDGADGDSVLYSHKKLELEDGVLSRDGWYFLDDSSNLRLDNSSWPWVYASDHKGLDWYFLGYGDDYKSGLYDFTQIAGKIPMVPRYALGYWWSRYWSYSDNEMRDLVSNFKRYHIPLDVLVVDMDWHKKGWTGWTWNKTLFPDPEGFLGWTNRVHLKTTLNLHPADGVAPYEDAYDQFAKNMKFDTTGRKAVPFVASDKDYMTNLFKVVLQPMENKGVDFWWLDWQQWPNDKKISSLSNTWWLNYVFYTEMERNRQTRPMLYHRWGGLGNHRYQIGFSGDSYISWKSLEYQPYFTNTASNVLYTYWSHDIGGHQLRRGEQSIDPELYTRWLQYGALSPIMRTHSTKNGIIKKELWGFSGRYAQAQYEAIRLRYALVPYIYTMARKTYDTGIGLCRPMYYDYPKASQAYSFSREYMFGDQLLVSPVGTPSTDGYTNVKVWLPAGNDWYEWHTGTLLKGGQELERSFAIDEYPLYVKAGSVIPMYGDEVQDLDATPDKVILGVFPGGDGRFALYEDNGNDKVFNEQHATTEITAKVNGRQLSVAIGGSVGSYKGMPAKREYVIKVFGSEMPERVLVDGKPLPFADNLHSAGWDYTGQQLCLNISLPEMDCRKARHVEVFYSRTHQARVTDGLTEKFKRLSLITTELKNMDNGIYLPEALGDAEETNRALEYYPDRFYPLINQFNADYKKIPDIIRSFSQIGDANQQKLLKMLR